MDFSDCGGGGLPPSERPGYNDDWDEETQSHVQRGSLSTGGIDPDDPCPIQALMFLTPLGLILLMWLLNLHPIGLTSAAIVFIPNMRCRTKQKLMLVIGTLMFLLVL